jgi:asparagine synthase (glutamine-hydrolysing)
MCGIAGSVNYKIDVNRLILDLKHRGPDDFGQYHEREVELYHFRLSIIDLKCGHQPMHFLDYSIVFNGEIYNHLELRDKFALDCNTGSDTETLLHLYHKLGIGMLEELDGMFAISLLDKRKNKLILIRDRAGKKPLYYYSKNRRFVYASELNALRNQVEIALNENNLNNYFRLGYMLHDQTPYNNVMEVLPGQIVYYDLSNYNLQTHVWWSINEYYEKSSSDSFEIAIEKVDSYLHEAVKRRVVASDLEVGSYLSGGIDSGLVTAIASEYKPNLKTFTVRFPGQFDESILASKVSDRYNTNHSILDLDMNALLDEVENILFQYGEPFADDSAIPSYYVSEMARKHLTVILNGDGGDELFGGYRRYVPFKHLELFNKKWKGVNLHGRILSPPNNKMSMYNYLYRLVQMSKKEGSALFLSATSDIFEEYQSLLKSNNTTDLAYLISSCINNKNYTSLNKIMLLDFKLTLPGALLVKMDIASMANGLEGRSPMLSKELMEYVPGLHDKLKIKGTNTKFLLRKLASRYLPDETVAAPKRGFEPPLAQWVNKDLKPLIDQYIYAQDNFYSEFLDKVEFLKIYERIKPASEVHRVKMIWTIFCFEVWYNKCYVRK